MCQQRQARRNLPASTNGIQSQWEMFRGHVHVQLVWFARWADEVITVTGHCLKAVCLSCRDVRILSMGNGVRIKIAQYISLCWWGKGWLQEACTRWRHNHVQLKHLKSGRSDRPGSLVLVQLHADNEVETCSVSKAIRSALWPHSGQIRTFSDYMWLHFDYFSSIHIHKYCEH